MEAAAAPFRSRPAGDGWCEVMPAARHESLAGQLLPNTGGCSPVGAGLPAIGGVRECPLLGANRQQAGSHKDTMQRSCRSWPASDGWCEVMPVARYESLAGKLLQNTGGCSPVGAGLPAMDGVRECPLPGTIRQQAGSYKGTPKFPCRSRPAGDGWREGMPVARRESPAGWLLQRHAANSRGGALQGGAFWRIGNGGQQLLTLGQRGGSQVRHAVLGDHHVDVALRGADVGAAPDHAALAGLA